MNTFVSGGIYLQDVHVRNDASQATPVTVLEKKLVLVRAFTACLDESLEPNHLLSTKELIRDSDIL